MSHREEAERLAGPHDPWCPYGGAESDPAKWAPVCVASRCARAARFRAIESALEQAATSQRVPCSCGKDDASVKWARCYSCRQKETEAAEAEGFAKGVEAAALVVLNERAHAGCQDERRCHHKGFGCDCHHEHEACEGAWALVDAIRALLPPTEGSK